MGEGLVNGLAVDGWEAVSAGTAPVGYVHPLAIRAMEEIGIDISAYRSKGAGEFRDEAIDLVVTVCDGAAQGCPVWLGSGHVVHVGFEDPASATGAETERLRAFRATRDGLRSQVVLRLDELYRRGRRVGPVED
jgi:arsenate reductase